MSRAGSYESTANAGHGGAAVSPSPSGTQQTSIEMSYGRADPSFIKQRGKGLQRTSSNTLHPPVDQQLRSRSPSLIAATLAVSRSVTSSPTFNGTEQRSLSKTPVSSRRSVDSNPSETLYQRSTTMAGKSADDGLDTTHIPPTNSLIGLFERHGEAYINREGSPSIKRSKKSRPVAIAITNAPAPPILSPRPVRHQPLSIEPLERPPAERSQIATRQSRNSPFGNIDGTRSEDFPRSTPREKSPSITPMPPPSRTPRSLASHANGKTFITPKDAATIENMANAIIASSLASSRAGTPSIQNAMSLSPEDRPKLPARRLTNHSLFHHHLPSRSTSTKSKRTPSPQKHLRETLRKPQTSDDDDDPNLDRATRRAIFKKHPNKHHEGDRKRWRDKVTERERKRYEALWASNKGLFVPTTETESLQQTSYQMARVPQQNGTSSLRSEVCSEMSDVVVNLVVKDIWSRSRLADDILSEVWDLVNRSGEGYLTKEEFVLGLWLIDQRLKGRKLPSKVGDTLWSTVEYGGVKVRNIKGKGRRSH